MKQNEQLLEMEKMRMGVQSSLKSIEAKKGKIEQIVKIRNRITYTVRFRILTLTAANSLQKLTLDDGETKRLSKQTKLDAPTEANKKTRKTT